MLVCLVMAYTKPLTHYAGKKLARRLTRSIPWIGGVIALAMLGSAIRRKGWIRGILHSGLDAIPYVGGVKNVAEAIRGRDFFSDRISSSPLPANDVRQRPHEFTDRIDLRRV